MASILLLYFVVIMVICKYVKTHQNEHLKWCVLHVSVDYYRVDYKWDLIDKIVITLGRECGASFVVS